jgi:hypothetical protein
MLSSDVARHLKRRKVLEDAVPEDFEASTERSGSGDSCICGGRLTQPAGAPAADTSTHVDGCRCGHEQVKLTTV